MTNLLKQSKRYTLHLLAFVTVIAVCTTLAVGRVPAQNTPARAPEHVQYVSIIQLIANPSVYDGKRVVVVGFTRFEFEGDALYLGAVDQKYRIENNAVALGIRKETQFTPSRKECDAKYCQVAGVFHAPQPQTSLLESGSISVTDIAFVGP